MQANPIDLRDYFLSFPSNYKVDWGIKDFSQSKL